MTRHPNRIVFKVEVPGVLIEYWDKVKLLFCSQLSLNSVALILKS